MQVPYFLLYSHFPLGFCLNEENFNNFKLLKLLDGLSIGSLLIEGQIIGKLLMIWASNFEDSTVVYFASSFENAKYRQYIFLFIWIFSHSVNVLRIDSYQLIHWSPLNASLIIRELIQQAFICQVLMFFFQQTLGAELLNFFAFSFVDKKRHYKFLLLLFF